MGRHSGSRGSNGRGNVDAKSLAAKEYLRSCPSAAGPPLIFTAANDDCAVQCDTTATRLEQGWFGIKLTWTGLLMVNREAWLSQKVNV
jgi:hypothetical protein